MYKESDYDEKEIGMWHKNYILFNMTCMTSDIPYTLAAKVRYHICLPLLECRPEDSGYDRLLPIFSGSLTVLNAFFKIAHIPSCVRWLEAPGFLRKQVSINSTTNGFMSSQYPLK